MPERRVPIEQLQPALLDRLTDRQPDAKLELRQDRVISKERMRAAVLRDLRWLFEATRLDANMDKERFPLARRSVINFGLPALFGRTAASFEVTDLEQAIRHAILDYEPRILPASLRVRALDMDGFGQHNRVGFEISGQLWAQPSPIELLIRTELDLEAGTVEIPDAQRPDA